MNRKTPILVLVALIASVLVLASPNSLAADPECAELERQVSDLTRRIEAMEKQLARALAAARTAQPRTAQAAKSKPTPKGPADIDPLYGVVDQLLADGDIAGAKQALAAKVESLNGQTTSLTKTLTRELGIVGEPIPDDWAIIKWFQGESAADLDGKGPTLLVFWESWCPYCKKEMPRFQKLYREYKDKGLQIVGLTRLTRDVTEASVRDVLTGNSVEFPVARESGAMATYFHVKGIPATAVVKDGIVIWRGHPLRLTDEMLESWL